LAVLALLDNPFPVCFLEKGLLRRCSGLHQAKELTSVHTAHGLSPLGSISSRPRQGHGERAVQHGSCVGLKKSWELIAITPDSLDNLQALSI
jgi:hypothetical protein